MGTPSPRYAAEFKQKAVELYGKSGTTYAEVARGLGCDPGSLSDWVKKADAADFGTGDNPFQMAEGLRRRVARIMRERGWRGVARACAKRPSGEKRASRRDSAEDLVRRRSEADGPNRAWFAGLATLIWTVP